MIQILQIINYMFQLGYSHNEIVETFDGLTDKTLDVSDLYDCLGLEFNKNHVSHIERSLPKWKSAYHIIKLRHEEGLQG